MDEILPKNLNALGGEKVEDIVNNASGKYAEFIEVLKTGGDELDSFPKAVPAGTMDPDMRTLLFDLTRFEKNTDKMMKELSQEVGKFVKPFPFDKEARIIYDLTERYHDAIEAIKTEGRAAIQDSPSTETLKTTEAREEHSKPPSSDANGPFASVEQSAHYSASARFGEHLSCGERCLSVAVSSSSN